VKRTVLKHALPLPLTFLALDIWCMYAFAPEVIPVVIFAIIAAIELRRIFGILVWALPDKKPKGES
jgi:hypothetical protein